MTERVHHLSPTLAGAFLGCRASVAWSLEARSGLREKPLEDVDPQAELVLRKGVQHEVVCLDALRSLHGLECEIRSDAKDRFGETTEAMARGHPLIYQAALGRSPWIGYADFLVRINEPSVRWAWSYEPWDAKLSRSAKPEQLLQIALYADMLEDAQGRVAERGHLMLGTGSAEEPYAVESFDLAHVRHYVRRAARRLEAFSSAPFPVFTPDPCGFCGRCSWADVCDERWETTDHLSRVADISRLQIARLRAHGIDTAASLADSGGTAIKGMAVETLARLVQQARLQRDSAASGTPKHELLPHRPGLGFDRMPAPDPGDLFFDFEGDPMHPGGLEYLCGVLWLEPGGGRDEPVPGYPDLTFRAFWAHDRAQEGRAFVELTRFLTAHLARHPKAHLYHYAPYEKTAFRRLASLHGVMETEVDDLLRSERLVDLYRVVREAIRVGEPSYSIKNLERFYMSRRTTEVTSGGDSLVIYDRFRETGENLLLEALRDYNRDDCLSTLLLRDWLAELARPTGLGPAAGAAPTQPTEREIEQQQAREAHEKADATLSASLVGAHHPDSPEGRARQLMADLVGFHRREDKPVWWAYFDRLGRDAEELCEDEECLGACIADGHGWIGREKQSFTFRMRYPEQDTKLRPGDAVYLAETGQTAGTILELDEVARMIVLKRGVPKGELPQFLSLIPGGPLDNSVLRQAVSDAASDMIAESPAYPHIAALLKGDAPRIAGRTTGQAIVPPGDRDDPERTLAAARDAVLGLDRSWLTIQGPPGAGKTYTISHLIASLVAAGKTVGIASNSHKAIDNVLHAFESRLDEAGRPVEIVGQKKDGGGEGFSGLGYIRSVTSNSQIDPTSPVVAGTAWLFARPEMRGSRDVLFIDEAGQVSLANLVAMATSARSIVLVGDHMQLSQPIQGAHPRRSGISGLDHLLAGESVVPPERGVFLSRTWRMHPDLCAFISDAVYNGRLLAEVGCSNQRLVLGEQAHPALKPTGLSFVPVIHAGNRQASPEEVVAVRTILADALLHEVIDRKGQRRRLGLSDILVVAPYNMQVNRLRDALPEGARVGTVDKFQGQEAEIVIVSMTTSGADDMPRDASFLLSRNRLNVALSRARCLSILVASPGLLDMVAGSVEEMKLANLLCWAEAYACSPHGDHL